MNLRRLGFGLATLLGIAQRGFFIPYRYGGASANPRVPYEAIESLFAARQDAFRYVLALIESHAAALLAIGDGAPPEPRWEQDWFPRLDGAAAYTLVRHVQPRLVIEVGSGHSTRFLARAVSDAGLDTRVVAIDPAPRADLAGLGRRVELVRATVQEVDPVLFRELGPGDVLLIDSSHILMPGTDVDLLLSDVLPTLPPGALVHVHDIFLPDDYPPAWAWRGYNEQLGIAALLTGNAFEPVFASHYVATRMQAMLTETVVTRLPLLPGAHEASLWLRRTGPAKDTAPLPGRAPRP